MTHTPIHSRSARFIAAIAVTACASAAMAAFDIPWSVVGGGGGESGGGAWAASATLGQTVSGAIAGGAYSLDSGYLPGAALPAACPGDTNGDRIVNTFDLARLLSNFGRVGSGLSGDLNGDGIVNTFDLARLLSHFGVACP